MTASLVVDLERAGELPISVVGAKARNLALAHSALDGATPTGFVVTTTALACWLDESRPSASPPLERAIASRYRELCTQLGDGDAAVVVRSSASVEDGSTRSCAGLFETRLDVRGPGDLCAAVRDVASGLEPAGVQRYLRSRGIEPTSASMAVLVMPMVYARVSGVAFSRDPSGGRLCAVIELASGLGARLVAGHGAEERHVVDLASGQSVEVEPAGGIRLLGAGPRARLLRLLERLHRSFAASGESGVDVEFAVDGAGRLVILQVRPYPITDSRTRSEPHARRCA